MRPILSLNGHDLATWHLTPLEGTIATLLKPFSYRNLPTLDNDTMNGAVLLSNPSLRRVQKRDISLLFYLRAADLRDQQRLISHLQDDLVKGHEDSGVNLLTMRDVGMTFRLVFTGIDKYTDFAASGCCTLSIKFTEPNPDFRDLV